MLTAVPDPVLEIIGQKSDRRDNQHNDQGKLPVQEKHGHKNAQYIGECPEKIHEVPGNQTCDLTGIIHDSG